MPFATKSFELRIPRVAIPKDSIRTFTVPDGTTVPKISSFSEFVNAFNSTNNTETSDSPARTIHTQADQRFPAMFIMHYSLELYSNLDVKKHPTVTPVSIAAYLFLIYHGFHLASDKIHSRIPSRHVNHFLADDNRRTFYSDLISATIPAQIESFLRLNMPTSDPRRPDIRTIPSYAAFNHDIDFGRFIPAAFFLLAHNVLSTTASNVNPNTVTAHWLTQNIASDGTNSILSVGNLIAFHRSSATAATIPDTWFSSSVLSLMTPIVARTLSSRYVYSPVNIHPIDFNVVDNLSTGFDGSVNTTYDVNDVNPYIFALNANDDNLDNMSRFMNNMSQILSDQHVGSSTIGSILNEESNVHLLSCAFTGPALPTWLRASGDVKDQVRSTQEAIVITDITPREFASPRAPTPGRIRFLHDRTFTASTRRANTAYPVIPTGALTPGGANPAALPFAMFTALRVVNFASTSATAPASPDKYLVYNQRMNYTPNIRVLLPFDANPSEAYVPQITGRLIETAEIASFNIPHVDSRLTLDHENSFFLSSAIPIRYLVLPSSDDVVLHDRTLPDPFDEPVSLHLYDASINRFGRALTDTMSVGNYPINQIPLGSTAVDGVRFTDLLSNVISFKANPESVQASIPCDDNFIYAWSPYRFLNAGRNSGNPRMTIQHIVDPRTFYGTIVPLLGAPHPATRFPSL